MSPEGNKQLQSYTNESDSTGMVQMSQIANSVGATGVVALITPTQVFVANAGDSRCVMSKTKNAVDLSIDHKPENPEEKVRIEAAGGFVEDNRVKGILNLSRSLGDCEYKADRSLPADKQMITAFPEIKTVKTNEPDFLILACDGIWDCMTSQEACDFVDAELKKGTKLSTIIANMFEKNIAEDISSKFTINLQMEQDVIT